MESSWEKTPPKSIERIRAGLESTMWQGGAAAPGPLRDGLPLDARLVVASFRTAESGRRFQQALLQAGVMSQGTFHRNGSEISVDVGDRLRAGELLDRHLLQFPDRAPSIERKDFDFTIFGTIIGATFGVIVVGAEFRGMRELLVPPIFTLFGAVSGRFVDRPRNRYRTSGRIQFGIGDLMVLTAAVGLGIALWRLMGGK